jgi:diacylglycerol kinase
MRHAVRGLSEAFRSERNFRIQTVAALAVILFILLFSVRAKDAAVLLLLIALVMILELVNTALEHFVDIVKPRIHLHVQTVKDVMAAAVLLASVFSLVIGALVMLPYILGALD